LFSGKGRLPVFLLIYLRGAEGSKPPPREYSLLPCMEEGI